MTIINRHLAGVMPVRKCVSSGVKPTNGYCGGAFGWRWHVFRREFGLVTDEQVEELIAHARNIDMETALKIEAEIHHDLMAELKTFAAQCPKAGSVLHMGATSMDIEDNADALRLRSSLDLILKFLGNLLLAWLTELKKQPILPVMAYTHIQPAEPSTLGYRLSMYAQDLLEDWSNLRHVRDGIRGKGFQRRCRYRRRLRGFDLELKTLVTLNPGSVRN